MIPRFGAGTVRTPMDLSALDAAACHQDSPALRPVIAASGRIDPRAAAELAGGYDNRGIQKAASGESLEKCSEPGVKGGADMGLVIGKRTERSGPVGVPGGFAENRIEHVDGDGRDTGFDQPRGSSAALLEAGIGAGNHAAARRLSVRHGATHVAESAGKDHARSKWSCLQKLETCFVHSGAFVMHRPDQRVFLGVAGHAGEDFGNLDARNIGADGAERASDFARRIGFHVPCVEVGRAAGKQQEDSAFGSGARSQEGQREAGFQELAPKHCP